MVNGNTKTPWMNDKIMELIRQRDNPLKLSPSYKPFNRLVFVHPCKMQNVKLDKVCKTMFLPGNNR